MDYDFTIADTSRTPCSVIKNYCKYRSLFCEYANENGYCRLTACLKPEIMWRNGQTIIWKGGTE